MPTSKNAAASSAWSAIRKSKAHQFCLSWGKAEFKLSPISCPPRFHWRTVFHPPPAPALEGGGESLKRIFSRNCGQKSAEKFSPFSSKREKSLGIEGSIPLILGRTQVGTR